MRYEEAKQTRFDRVGTVIIFIFLLIGLISFPVYPVHAGTKAPPPLKIDNWMESYPLSRYMSFYFDETGELTIEEAADRKAQLFKSLNNSSVNLGVTKAVLWLRFELVDSDAGGSWVLDMDRPLEQKITLYYRNSEGAWRSVASCGEPPCDEGVQPRRSMFPLPRLSAVPLAFYLRIETQTSQQYFPKISRPVAYWEKSKRQYLGQGLYFGLCLAMILYNLSIFIYLGDRTYLYYVLYVLCLAVYFAVTYGLAVELITFISVLHLIKIDLIGLGLSITIAAQFTRAFLLTRKNSPWSDRVLLGYMCLAASGPLLTPFMEIQSILPLYNLLGALGPPITLIPAVVCLRRGFRPARFFIVAYACFTGGVVVFISAYTGVIPLTKWVFHSFQIGSALEIILLALALGDRIRLLRQEKEALAESQKYYKKTSILDGLTGLYNRRCYEGRIVEEIRKAQQSHQPLSLLILDIDHFKQLNDNYGHPQGDTVLKELGAILRKNARKNDVPCRYGGEEFVLILPQADLTSACRAAERIREEFARKPYDMGVEKLVQATLSIGVAELEEEDSAVTLLKKADDALYRAKRDGRNRISY